jgi:segregation and condensation protein B
VEAVLFLAREPLGSRKLALLAGLADGTKARTLVRTLNRRYDAEGSAFRVEEVGGGFQLLTRAEFVPWLRRLCSAPAEVRLSAPAMETLAVVAYRQPVLRAEIEAIRGVQCGEVLRQLIQRDLVRIVGRSEELGRPLLYGTTRQFLQVFGLRHLEDLPRTEFLPMTKRVAEAIRPAGADPSEETSDPVYHSREILEETQMKTTLKTQTVREELDAFGLALATQPEAARASRSPRVIDAEKDEDEDDDFDDDEEDDEDDEEEDDLDDEPWEEVDDEDDDLDDDDDEGWDDDEDDDWDDDDEDEDEDESLEEDEPG